MLEIIKALLKDPAGISEEVKEKCDDWLEQEMYNQEDLQYRVSWSYKEELDLLYLEWLKLTKAFELQPHHSIVRWIKRPEAK